MLPRLHVQVLPLLRVLMLQCHRPGDLRLPLRDLQVFQGLLHGLCKVSCHGLQVLPIIVHAMHQLRQVHLCLLLEALRTMHQLWQVHLQVPLWLSCEVQLLQCFMWPSLPQATRVCLHLPLQNLWLWPDLPLFLRQLWLQALFQDA